MNTQTRKLTEGAAVIAIMGVFLLIDRQFLGILSSYSLFLLPIPMMFYSAKYGLKSSLPVLFGMVVIAFLFSTITIFIYVLGECVIGLVYGSNVYRKSSSKMTLITTIILAVLVEIACTIIMIRFFGYRIDTEINSIKDMMNNVATISGDSNLSSTVSLFESLGLFTTIFYVSTVLIGVLEALLTHVLGRTVLNRFKIEVPKGDTLLTHYPPKWLGYICLVGFVLYFYSIKKPFGNELLEMSVQFLGTACMIYLLGYGIVAVYVYFITRGLKPNPILLFLLTILLISFFSIFTVIIGFLYITTDIHKRMVSKE